MVICYVHMASCVDTDGEKSLVEHFIQNSPAVVRVMKKMLMFLSWSLWRLITLRQNTLMLYE